MLVRTSRAIVRTLMAAAFCLTTASVHAQPMKAGLPANFSIASGALEKPWTGDLDGMMTRRDIRVLTVHSRTLYFADNGVLHGIVVDFGKVLEDDLNKKLAKDKTNKQRNLKLRVAFIPTQRDHLLTALAAGKGDIAAANLTITPERQKIVDFSAAGLTNVSEVAVTGPASPKIATVDDLSGKTVFVRKSSSY